MNNKHRTLIFIPGLMGSQLRTSAGDWLWNEDPIASISNLASNPALYNANSPLIADGILSHLNFFGLVKRPLASGLINLQKVLVETNVIDAHDHFSYDWRQSIFTSAQYLGEWIKNVHTHGEGDTTPINNKTTVSFVAHSMGCLILATSLVMGYIDPWRIDRIVMIGGPFRGAPSAFRGLFTPGYIPGMDFMLFFKVLGTGYRHSHKEALMAAFRSFESVHQLLPSGDNNFVWMDREDKINPLTDEKLIIPQSKRQSALRLQSTLQEFDTWLFDHQKQRKQLCTGQLSIFNIVGSDGNSGPTTTSAEFNATYGSEGSTLTYKSVFETRKVSGDKTVPKQSACSLTPIGVESFQVLGTTHASMCSDSRVLSITRNCLS